MHLQYLECESETPESLQKIADFSGSSTGRLRFYTRRLKASRNAMKTRDGKERVQKVCIYTCQVHVWQLRRKKYKSNLP
jgi:hypothetical protein